MTRGEVPFLACSRHRGRPHRPARDRTVPVGVTDGSYIGWAIDVGIECGYKSWLSNESTTVTVCGCSWRPAGRRMSSDWTEEGNLQHCYWGPRLPYDGEYPMPVGSPGRGTSIRTTATRSGFARKRPPGVAFGSRNRSSRRRSRRNSDAPAGVRRTPDDDRARRGVYRVVHRRCSTCSWISPTFRWRDDRCWNAQ